LLIFVGALFLKSLETKVGRIVVKGVNKIRYPIMKWYENLPNNPRNIVGWLSLTFYCLGIVAIFIWLES
jgi:hypothetical protein